MPAASSRRSSWVVWFVLAVGVAVFVSALGGRGAGALTSRNILIACAAAIVVYLVLNADPAWLISGGLALAVFNGNWDVLGFHSYAVPDRVLIGAGVIALLFRIPPQAMDRPPITARPEYWVIAGAVVYILTSSILAGSIDENPALFRMLDRFGLVPFLMFVVAPVAFRTRRQRGILLGALAIAGTYLAWITWAETAHADPLIWPKYILDPSIGVTPNRGRGPFAAADANGLALVACAVAAMVGIWHWRRPIVRLACAGIAAGCLSATFLTLTRSVWVATAAAGIVTMLSFRQLRPFFVPAAAAMTVAVLFSLAAIPGLSERADARRDDDRPVWDRRNSNAAALRMLADRPLVGFGWDRYLTYNNDYFEQHPDFPLTGNRVPLHNVYLSNAVELGALGAGLWIAALLVAIGGTILRRGPPELFPWRVALVAIAVQWAVESALAPFGYSFPNLILWTVAGVAAGLRPEQVRAAWEARRLVAAPAS